MTDMVRTCKEEDRNLRDQVLISNQTASLWVNSAQHMTGNGLRIKFRPTTFDVLQQLLVQIYTSLDVLLTLTYILHDVCMV